MDFPPPRIETPLHRSNSLVLDRFVVVVVVIISVVAMMFLRRGNFVQSSLFASALLLPLLFGQPAKGEDTFFNEEDFVGNGTILESFCSEAKYIDISDYGDKFEDDGRFIDGRRDKVDVYVCPNSDVEDADVWMGALLKAWQAKTLSDCVLTYPVHIKYGTDFGSDCSGEKKCYAAQLFTETIYSCNAVPRCAGRTVLCCDFGLCFRRRRTQEEPELEPRRRLDDILDFNEERCEEADVGQCNAGCGRDGSDVVKQLKAEFGEISVVRPSEELLTYASCPTTDPPTSMPTYGPTRSPTEGPTSSPTITKTKICSDDQKIQCSVNTQLSFGRK